MDFEEAEYEAKQALPVVFAEKSEVSFEEKTQIANYIKKVNSFPILTEEEEKHLLIDLFQNQNINAGHIILNSHLRLVVKIALQYKTYHNSLLDLIAEGNLGLLKALKNFSIEKQVRFATYAMLWIKASIREFLIKSISSVKAITTNSQKKLLFGLSRVKKLLNIRKDDKLTLEQSEKIADILNVQNKDILEYERIMIETKQFSLNETKFQDNGIEFSEITSNGENLEDTQISKNTKQLLKVKIQEALKKLSPKEGEIITFRMLNEEKLTLADLSEKLQISKERVRQIQESALKKLKQILEEDSDFKKIYQQYEK